MKMLKLAIVGEAWGEVEERTRNPFSGPSGYELTRMLGEAGINRRECFLTNVFNLRPEKNDVESLCGTGVDAWREMPPLKPGKHVHRKYASELTRLYSELSNLRPNLILALGNTATWAILFSTGISKVRGTVSQAVAPPIAGMKVLPTYHPAAVLRQWELRHVTVLDFFKAAMEQEFPEVRRPERTIYIEPSLSDMEWYFNEHLRNADRISFDIETAGRQITCIGFAPGRQNSLVIPFVDPRKPGGSYWPTLQDERDAWNFVRRVLRLPCSKIAQNGLYDIRFLWESYGITVTNFTDDTMLLHHSLYPESEKGLGFLGSVYTGEASWKLMRPRGKTTIKREE